ncbi:MAG: tail fiber domain-containing protein, partial [Saprospiraceae bacterium]|nr:tail fiber domain-containing protein [Saprospiraceae bacterium]
MKPIIVVILCTLLSSVIANAQKIEAESSASETVIHAVNSNSVSTSSRGVYGEGYHGLEGMAKGANGIGVKGTSTTSTGIFGTSTSGRGVWGDSESSYGVLGGSDESIAVYGISGLSAGVLGQSTSGSGTSGTSTNSYGLHGTSQNFHGAWIRGNPTGGFGDIVLGGSNYFGGNDDGVIMSDPTLIGSDIFLVSNDAVVVEIDNDTTESGSFEVWNDINREVLILGEDGEFEIWNGASTNDRRLWLQSDGDLFIDGALTEGSDRHRKENIESVTEAYVLEKIMKVPVYS